MYREIFHIQRCREDWIAEKYGINFSEGFYSGDVVYLKYICFHAELLAQSEAIRNIAHRAKRS